jgi:hypothetical protein
LIAVCKVDFEKSSISIKIISKMVLIDVLFEYTVLTFSKKNGEKWDVGKLFSWLSKLIFPYN